MTMFLYVAVFVATVLALEAIYLLFIAGRSDQATVKRRLGSLASRFQANAGESSILRRDEAAGALEDLVDAIPGGSNLGLHLYRAGLTISPPRFVLLSAAMGLGGWLLGSVFLADPLRSAPFLAAAALPTIQMMRLERKRMGAFEAQFPGALELLTRALRAGNSLTFGLQMVGEELADPVGTEFQQVAEEIKLGKSVRAALDNLQYRINVADLPFFVTAVSIQTTTGGNLAEILDNLGYVIRERFKLYGKVRALTAMGRASANLLAVWPLVMVGTMYMVNPKYIEPLWTSESGPYMALTAFILVVIGYFVCLRMAKIKV